MNLRIISCRDLAAKTAFLADVDDMIRLPNGELEVVAVAIKPNGKTSRTIKPVLLTIEDGTWRFDDAPDPAGTMHALVKLAKTWLPRREIGSQSSMPNVRVFEFSEGTYDHGRWMIVVYWDIWNARGLQWKERQAEMKKLGFPAFAKMKRTTFNSLCLRTLKLKIPAE